MEKTFEGHEHFPEDDEMIYDGDEEAAMFMGHSDQDACRDSPGSSKGLPLVTSQKESPAESQEFHQKQEDIKNQIVEETQKTSASQSNRIEKEISSTHMQEDRAVEARMKNERLISNAENTLTALVRYRKKSKPNPPWHNSELRRRDVRWGTSHKSWRPWQ